MTEAQATSLLESLQSIGETMVRIDQRLEIILPDPQAVAIQDVAKTTVELGDRLDRVTATLDGIGGKVDRIVERMEQRRQASAQAQPQARAAPQGQQPQRTAPSQSQQPAREAPAQQPQRAVQG